MNRELVHALTGYATGYKLYPELNSFTSVPVDDTATQIRNLLGTADEYWAVQLASIVESQNVLGINDPELEDEVILENQLFLKQTPDFLVSDTQGPANVTTAEPQSDHIPGTRIVNVRYDAENKIARIYAYDNSWIVNCRYVNDRILLTWPKELGITGAILAPNTTATFEIETFPSYPKKAVIAKLSTDEDFYRAAEALGYTLAFFYADSDDEKLSVAARILYKHIQNLKK